MRIKYRLFRILVGVLLLSGLGLTPGVSAQGGGKRIMLEAGHGNSDSGAMSCDGTHKEVDVNWAVAEKAATILRTRGHQVDVVGSGDMDNYQGDAFVALHVDWCASGASGYKVSRYGGAKGTGLLNNGDASDNLAKTLWEQYGSTTGLSQDTSPWHFTDNMVYYYALNSSVAGIASSTPGAIIEMGWWSGDENALLNRQDDLAQGIANSILVFLGEQPGPGDIIPPTTTATPSGTAGEAGWYRSNVTVTLTATDNSGGTGVNHIEYRVDGGSWQSGSAVTLSTEGSHTLGYRTQDNTGNWESEKQTPVNIDTTAPTGSLIINNNASVSYANLVYLNPTGNDTLSGVSQVRFRDVGGSWSSWQPITAATLWQLPVATGQTSTVEVQFQDRAGNQSGVYSDNILLNIYPARPSSAGYRLTRSTFGVSGGLSDSTNYQLNGTLGQSSAVSGMSGGSYLSAWGYWRPDISSGGTSKVYLPIIIR